MNATAMRIAIVGLAALALPLPAMANQTPCSKRADVLAQLGGKYQEAPVSVGIANNGGLIEVLTTTNGSTWTIILSLPNGMSCLLAAGEDWQNVTRISAQEPQV
jgi:hypothetical protein